MILISRARIESSHSFRRASGHGITIDGDHARLKEQVRLRDRVISGTWGHVLQVIRLITEISPIKIDHADQVDQTNRLIWSTDHL